MFELFTCAAVVLVVVVVGGTLVVVVFDALLLLLLLLLLAVELVAGEWGNIRAKLPRLLCSSMVSTSTRRSSGVITSSIVPMLA